MSLETRYLIVRADRRVRVVNRRPFELRGDEVAIRLVIKFPDGWGKIDPAIIEIEIPSQVPSIDRVEME